MFVSGVLILCVFTAIGQVGIGTTSPNSSAMLDVSSTIRGFLPPRMDSSQRNAILSPVAGLTIYNTSINAIQVYNGNVWYSSIHYIGESYGGGIVYFLYDNGQHGLISAINDQSTGIKWCITYTNTFARADGVYAGKKNIALIISNQADWGIDNFASRICNEFSVTVNDVTYGDWYLPSKYELNLLFLQKDLFGNFAETYWSSTEANNDQNTWVINFNSQNTYTADKLEVHKVRAISAF